MRSKKCGLGIFLDYMDDVHDLQPGSLNRAVLTAYHGYHVHERRNTLLTANQRVLQVKTFWDWAHDHDDYESVVSRPKRIDLPDAHAELEPYAPTWDQMDRAVAQAEGWLRQAFIVMRFTMLRGEQVMALEWRDLDLETGVLRIRPEIGKTKAEKRGRWVPISPHLLEVLQADDWPRDPVYIVKSCPRRRAGYERLHRAWRGIDIPDLQPRHAFRRGGSTGLALSGAMIQFVDVLMGHKTNLSVDTYMGALALMPQLRAVVGMIPPLNRFEDIVVPFGAS